MLFRLTWIKSILVGPKAKPATTEPDGKHLVCNDFLRIYAGDGKIKYECPR